jgi:hypothetical protein
MIGGENHWAVWQMLLSTDLYVVAAPHHRCNGSASDPVGQGDIHAATLVAARLRKESSR